MSGMGRRTIGVSTTRRRRHRTPIHWLMRLIILSALVLVEEECDLLVRRNAESDCTPDQKIIVFKCLLVSVSLVRRSMPVNRGMIGLFVVVAEVEKNESNAAR